MAEQKTLAFKKVKYDHTDIPPDAPAGTWNASLKVKKSTSDRPSGKCPMLRLEWTLKEFAGEGDPSDEQEKALGTTVFDYWGFVPKGDKWEKGCKKKGRDIMKLAGIDLASLPTSYGSWEDFDPIIEALDGQTFTISTVVKDKNGEKSTEPRYRVSGETPPIRTAAEDDADDEDDDEPAPVKPKAKAKPPVEEEEDDEDEEEETEEEDEEEEEDEPPPPPVKKKKTAVKK